MDSLAKIGSDIEQVVGQSPTFTDWWLSPNSIEPYKELRLVQKNTKDIQPV